MLNTSVNYVGTKARAKFKGDCLKQEKVSFDHGKIVNIYTVDEIDKYVNISSYSTLENCLFGTVELTKYVDTDPYKYFGYVIGFERKGFFSIVDEIGRNVKLFGVDMRSSSRIDNKKKDCLNYTKQNTKLCLSLHCYGANSYLFVNGSKIIKFKAKDSEIKAYPLC